jgi:hypothetical protein
MELGSKGPGYDPGTVLGLNTYVMMPDITPWS